MSAPACAQDGLQQEDGQFRLVEAFPNLSFSRPVDFQVPDDDSDRVFVVEQAGLIRVFEHETDVGGAEVFLDIEERVRDQGNEEGLLGLAFHPDYAENGQFYLDYTASNPRRTVVARYQVDPQEPSRALRDSEEVILEVEQPYGNHNGGQIVFGPDGYLYITLGDGGSGGDPQENGQDPTTLLGTILRIDVDSGTPYGIPADNPFAGNEDGYREEIFAYGLRNVWRFSFDPQTGRLWAADVGQNAYEEVDIIESGRNYGWDVMEGFHCFEPETGCDESGLTLPVWEYSHDLGSSITGGFVYRGQAVPSLAGRYVFADYVSGRIWAAAFDGEDVEVEQLIDTSLAISSFGVDLEQELYALAFDGNIYRFEGVDVEP
jgi:glucose/arabinose dehydrogenase